MSVTVPWLNMEDSFNEPWVISAYSDIYYNRYYTGYKDCCKIFKGLLIVICVMAVS